MNLFVALETEFGFRILQNSNMSCPARLRITLSIVNASPLSELSTSNKNLRDQRNVSIDFVNELPVADVRLGPRMNLRIYGFADIEPRLVELRVTYRFNDRMHLTCEQAEAIAAGLLAAVKKARA